MWQEEVVAEAVQDQDLSRTTRDEKSNYQVASLTRFCAVCQVCPDACFYSCAKQERVKAGDSKLHKKNDYKFIIPNELTTTTEAASSQSHSGNARPLPAPAVMLPPELVVVPMPVKMKSLCVNEFIVPAKVHFIYADTRLATYESVLQFWVCIIVREKGRGQATLIGAFRPPVTPTCLN
ncbi:hypothetical protein Y032_0065g3665 [Ancylostoma ceylanicum]|uniref:Uncharacterized protein n=1 Tax=Ancylostoma ceylanicum TaxID=53326 RepID=A0A016U1C0_9BILA|nr:hypothetical protein Y032_0065g3665 [Ancylostoma ceylanicum]